MPSVNVTKMHTLLIAKEINAYFELYYILTAWYKMAFISLRNVVVTDITLYCYIYFQG